MEFNEAFQAINELAVYGRVHALASNLIPDASAFGRPTVEKRLAEAQRVVDAEFRRLRKIEAAAEEFIDLADTWSHNELVKVLEAP